MLPRMLWAPAASRRGLGPGLGAVGAPGGGRRPPGAGRRGSRGAGEGPAAGLRSRPHLQLRTGVLRLGAGLVLEAAALVLQTPPPRLQGRRRRGPRAGRGAGAAARGGGGGQPSTGRRRRRLQLLHGVLRLRSRLVGCAAALVLRAPGPRLPQRRGWRQHHACGGEGAAEDAARALRLQQGVCPLDRCMERRKDALVLREV
mmetsp:Transcript_77125/g.213155  ORF Transcript_77125/g.213155 Transcript_77125/m.213155 type:complete len:201 (+) Transcript_77125:342-944(+)